MTHSPGAKRLTTLSLLLAVVAAVAVLAGLTATGGSAGAADRPTPTPEATTGAVPVRVAPAAQPPVARDEPISPQMQLDDTDAEWAARIGAWQECLVEHGARWAKDLAVRDPLGVAPTPVADPVPAAAKAACQDVLPRLPVETDPNLNPDYVADSEANVACLRAHGIAVHLYHDTSVYPDGLSWTYDASDTPLPDNQSQIERRCELKAFGG